MFSLACNHHLEYVWRLSHLQPLHLNFLLSALTVRCHHMVSFRMMSPNFSSFPQNVALSLGFSGHNSPSFTDELMCYQTQCAPSHFSSVLQTPSLTCIDNDCCWNESIKAASLTTLQNILIVGCPPSYTVHYASLIANHPTDTRHVHYGTDGFQAVRARSHLERCRLSLAGSADELGHLLFGFAEDVSVLSF